MGHQRPAVAIERVPRPPLTDAKRCRSLSWCSKERGTIVRRVPGPAYLLLSVAVLLAVPACADSPTADALRVGASPAPVGAGSGSGGDSGSVNEPVAAADNKIVVEYSLLQIDDLGFGQQPADLTAGAGLAEVVPGVVYLLSGLNDHEADVRMELWAAEPPEPAGDWPERETHTASLVGPALSLSVVSGDSAEEELRSISPGQYRVQVLRHLKAAPRQLPSPLFSGGYESWLVRFWLTDR